MAKKRDGRAGRRRWTPQEDAVLSVRYADERTSAIARDLRRTTSAVFVRANKLGLQRPAEYLAALSAENGRRLVAAGVRSRFPPAHVPFNKGLRRPGWSPGRMRETQFKPGHRGGCAAERYQPIGTERISKDGYVERKVNDDLPMQRRWKFVHVLVWEAARGPVPKGHALVFRNGDRRDIRLDNLELITRRELMARNSVHNLPAPLVGTVMLLGRLRRQIRRREKENAA